MDQYLRLLKQVRQEGVAQENRTGIKTYMIPGGMMTFDLEKGFPAVTTKTLYFRQVVGELLGFLRGYTSAAQFRKLGCTIWDQNANENESWLNNPARKGEDDLGYIYSRLWTDMPHNLMTERWNQIDRLIDGIKTDPLSRRHIVSAWHPEVFDKAALPPCHVLFQVIIEQATKKMHMTMYQRSCDMFLGVPFNIASYSLLLHILCKFTGYNPGKFTWFGADVHIYENHLEQVDIQLLRTPMNLPTLKLVNNNWCTVKDINPEDIILEHYHPYGPLKASMAV